MTTTALATVCLAAPTWANSTKSKQASGFVTATRQPDRPQILLAQAGLQGDYDIAAQPLAQALSVYGQQSGIQVAVDPAIVAGKSSSRVFGRMTAEEALGRLLAGSGVSYQFTSAGAVTIHAVAGGGGITVLPPVAVESTAPVDPSAAYDPVQGYRATYSQGLTRVPAEIKETPYSISVVTKDVIRDRASTTLDEMLETTPGVARGGSGRGFYNTPVLRGFKDTGEPNSLLRENGLAAGVNYPADPAIIERVEVIKGPASIAGGRITPGGFINRLLKSPLPENNVAGGGSVDTFGTYRANADVNYVLSDSHETSARIVVAGQAGDEYVQRTDERHIALLPSFKTQIGEQTTATVMVNIFKADGASYAGTPIFNDGSIPDIPADTNFGGDGAQFENANYAFNGEVVHDFLDGLKLTTRGGGGRSLNDFTDIYGYNLQSNGNAGIYAARRRTKSNYFTGDVFLTKSFDFNENASDVTFGVDILDQVQKFRSGYTYLGANNIFTSQNSFAVPDNFDFGQTPLANRKAALTQIGTYGQVILRPIPRLTVMGGGRYDIADQSLDDFLTETNRQDDEKKFTGRGGLSYEIGGGVSVYGSYAESFIPQVFSVTRDGSFLPPETGNQYEAGAKWEPLERLGLTASIFRIERTNAAEPDPTNANFSVASGKQRIDGLELEAVGEVLPGLNIAGGFTQLNAKVTESSSTPGASQVGTRPRHVPKRRGSIWATYEIQSGAWRGLGFGGGIVSQDFVYAQVNNQVPIEGYTRADATVFYNGFTNVQIRLNIENLSNTRYIADPGTRNYNQFGEPLNATFSVDFKL